MTRSGRYLFGALGALALSAQALAATVTVDSVVTTEGTESVQVAWAFENSDENVRFLAFDIGFDETLAASVLTVDESDCLDGVSGVDNSACIILPSGAVALTLGNDPDSGPLPSLSGSLTLNFAPGLQLEDEVDFTLLIDSVTPEDADVTLSPGTLTVRDTDAELSISPESFDFEELDLLAPAACTNFELSNSEGDDALTIGTVSISEPFSVNDVCDDETLAGGASCTVEVCFDPDAEGEFSETLTATSSANDVTATVEGEGTAEAVLVVNPDFGPVNLGAGLQGSTLSATGSVVNTGSADATVECSLVDENDPSVFSTDLPLGDLITVEAGADPIPFEVSCALPEDAEDGDSFSAQIQCDVDRQGVSEDTTHFLTCGVSEFEPLPVPTMSNWSIALFAMLMLLVGGISIRFFRV